MSLLGPLFRWDDVQESFSDRASLQAMLDFEAALARAEAQAGVIPASAASMIESACAVHRFDVPALAREAANAGNLVIPLIRQLTAHVREQDAEAARFVHWGATSQDAIDTGLVLQLRAALDVIEGELDRLADAPAALASEHGRRRSPPHLDAACRPRPSA